MFARVVVTVVSCVLLAGCKSDVTNQSSITDPNVNQAPTQTSPNANGNLRDSASGTVTSNRRKSVNGTAQSPMSPVAPAVADAGKILSKPLLDASDQTLSVGSDEDCTGTFRDSNGKDIKVSVELVESGDEAEPVPLLLKFQCQFSVVNYETVIPASTKVSCRKVQSALSSVPICDARDTIGGKHEFSARMSELFGTATDAGTENVFLAYATDFACPALSSIPTVNRVTVGVPRRNPEGLPTPLFEIAYDFRELIWSQFYHASDFADIKCPTTLKLQELQTNSQTLKASLTTIVNAL
jgi:hypothetical protein